MKILMFLLQNVEGLKLKGFTILEVVVTLAVLVIIVGSLAVVFRTLTTTWNKAETGIEATQSAYATLEQISREIKSAIIDAANKFYLLGIDKIGSHISQTISDEIYFVAPLKDSGEQNLYEVGYWLKDSGSDKDGSLRRHLTGVAIPVDFTTSVTSSTSDIFATNITGFEVLFWGATTTDWTNAAVSWDSKISGLPIAVKIKLKITDDRKTFEREFEKVIYLAGS